MQAALGISSELIYTILMGSFITSMMIFGTLYWLSRSGKKRKPPLAKHSNTSQKNHGRRKGRK